MIGILAALYSSFWSPLENISNSPLSKAQSLLTRLGIFQGLDRVMRELNTLSTLEIWDVDHYRENSELVQCLATKFTID